MEDERYKLRYPIRLLGVAELYRIDEDPTEQLDRAAEDPSVVEELANALSAFPQGATIHLQLWRIVWDVDFFGGEEDREPWADIVNQVSKG